MSGSVKLYEHTEAKLYIDSLLAETEGEITPEIEQLMDESELALKDKIEAVAARIRELEAFAGAAKTEADRIAKLGKSADAQAESLTRYLLVNMQRASVPKVETPRFKISIRENPPKCEAITAEPSIVQTLRAALLLGPADETPDFDASEVDEAATAVAIATDVAVSRVLVGEEIDLLEQCVIVTPERVVPESREWDKKALIALNKTHPATVAAVARITRGTRLEIK